LSMGRRRPADRACVRGSSGLQASMRHSRYSVQFPV
jgi:hypothetical protein